MNPISEDIKDVLVAESDLKLIFNRNLFVGGEPTSPDNCITLFDAAGGSPSLTYKKGEDYRYGNFQIRSRNIDYKKCYEELNNIRDFLHGKSHETHNDTKYLLINAIDEPFFLDRDDNGRARWVVNFSVQRK